MKLGKARCTLRNPGPESNIERLPCYTGIDNENVIGKLGKSRRSNGFTEEIWQEFGKLGNCLPEESVTN